MLQTPRRSIASLEGELRAERKTLVILTEGPSDKFILKSAVRKIGKDASFYCVDEIDIPSPPENPIFGGNKGRLLRAISDNSFADLPADNILAIVDDDGDSLIGLEYDRKAVRTNGTSLTLELVDVVGMSNFVSAVLGKEIEERVISECVAAEKKLFSMKVALRAEGIDVPDFSVKAACNNGIDAVSIDKYIQEHCAIHVKSAEMEQKLFKNALKIDNSINQISHGANSHRLFDLMARHFHSQRLTKALLHENEWSRSSRVAGQQLTPENSATVRSLVAAIDRVAGS